MRQPFDLTVNGARRHVEVEPDASLLHVLRQELGLVGSRFGCGVGLCGACFVLLDGRPAPACDTPVWSVGGQPVVTVEGLAADGALHPVQQACSTSRPASAATACRASWSARPRCWPSTPARPRTRRSRRSTATCAGAACSAGGPRGAAGRARRAAPGMTGPLPGSLQANPRLPTGSRGRGRTARSRAGRQGRARPGHRHRARPDRRRRARRALDAVRMPAATTGAGPDEGTTAGSMSIAVSGPRCGWSCAHVRALFVAPQPARARPRDDRPSRRHAARPGRAEATYGELAASSPRRAVDPRCRQGAGRPAVVGTSAPRLDLPDKVAGRPRFIARPAAARACCYGRVRPAAVTGRPAARGRRGAGAGGRAWWPSSGTGPSSASWPAGRGRRRPGRDALRGGAGGTRRRPLPDEDDLAALPAGRRRTRTSTSPRPTTGATAGARYG